MHKGDAISQTHECRRKKTKREEIVAVSMAAIYTHGRTENGVTPMDRAAISTARTSHQLHPRLLAALPRSTSYRSQLSSSLRRYYWPLRAPESLEPSSCTLY